LNGGGKHAPAFLTVLGVSTICFFVGAFGVILRSKHIEDLVFQFQQMTTPFDDIKKTIHENQLSGNLMNGFSQSFNDIS
jgi:hypothetical protein